MSGDDSLVVDGATVRFLPGDDGRLHVTIGDVDVGALEADSSGFAAFGPTGEALTRPSQWGGRVTARFGSKELAVRALLDNA